MDTRRDETDAERCDRNWSDLDDVAGLTAGTVVLVLFLAARVVLPLSLLHRGTGTP